MSRSGPPELADVVELSERYPLPFAQADRLPGVIERDGLMPPPGV